MTSKISMIKIRLFLTAGLFAIKLAWIVKYKLECAVKKRTGLIKNVSECLCRYLQNRKTFFLYTKLCWCSIMGHSVCRFVLLLSSRSRSQQGLDNHVSFYYTLTADSLQVKLGQGVIIQEISIAHNPELKAGAQCAHRKTQNELSI